MPKSSKRNFWLVSALILNLLDRFGFQFVDYRFSKLSLLGWHHQCNLFSSLSSLSVVPATFPDPNTSWSVFLTKFFSSNMSGPLSSFSIVWTLCGSVSVTLTFWSPVLNFSSQSATWLFEYHSCSHCQILWHFDARTAERIFQLRYKESICSHHAFVDV